MNENTYFFEELEGIPAALKHLQQLMSNTFSNVTSGEKYFIQADEKSCKNFDFPVSTDLLLCDEITLHP